MYEDYRYKLMDLPDIDFSVFKSYCDNLVKDEYVDIERYRRYSCFKGEPFKLKRQKHKVFVQGDVNQLLAHVEREYEEMEDGFVQLKEFNQIVESYVDLTGINPKKTEMGFHQMRMCIEYDKPIPLAAEGRHQDDFDHIGLVCLGMHNVTYGAHAHLFVDNKTKKPFFEKRIVPNEILVINDRKIFHHGTDIFTDKKKGYYDMLVITANKQ
jgi:hypothetical protein